MAFKSFSSITLKEILEIISEFDILSHYLGINKVPVVINSPFRQDTLPSCSIYTRDGSKMYYKDFGSNDSGSTINLLMKLWNCSYYSAVDKISHDLVNIINKEGNAIINKKNISSKHICSKGTDIQVKVREWRDYDLKFWGRFGIDLPWLQFGDIYPISHIFISKENNESYIIPADKYAYVYVEFKDNKLSLKIYQPFSERYKWMSKHDNSVWDLWNKLPDSGETLIITKSRKDALSIWKNTGIPSTGLQGEGYIPKEHVVQQLKDRFNKIFILYDNDFDREENYGRIYGKIIADKYNLEQIEIPDVFQSKDCSDLYQNYGKEKQKEIILKLINNKKYESSVI